MELVRDFKNITKNDIALAGGKGASLGEMTRVGIPVPPGFVILSSSFEEFLREKKMPKNVAEEIKKSFKKLSTKRVAVRSSATAEDSKSAAWAGQLESYLNTTEKNLLENVKKCWESLSAPRAAFYRSEHKLQKQKISVAVVIQKMIQSDISGICFTVHPVTENKNQIIIEAGYGLGEAIVGGKITPDTYIMRKNDLKILDTNISNQKMMMVKGKNGITEKLVPKSKQEKQKLPDKQILKLAQLCKKIEKHYKTPQDIEWAFEKGKLYILQSRPITTL